MRRTYGTWTTFVLAWAVLISPLGACSREAPANRGNERDGDAAKVPGCELITGAEIQEATGLAPDRSEQGSSLVRDCNWSTADGRPLVGVAVGGAPRTYEEYVQNMREQLGSKMEDLKMNRVEGVGNYAVWHSEGYLNVVQGNDLLMIWIFAEPAGEKLKQEAAVELARKALPRL
jgi:hypothetical protein